MILPIKIETLLWLLPVVFMIHEFEEIIMMKPWLNKNWEKLENKFPKKVVEKMDVYRQLSVSAFSLVVAEEFILLAVFTFIAVEFEFYDFWAGLVIGFLIHLLVHVVQFLVFRKYVPFILTSIPAGIFCFIALHDANICVGVEIKMVILWSLFFTIFIFANLFYTIRLSVKFDKWINTVN